MRLIDADKETERLKKGYCEECIRKGKYGIFGAACTPCWVKDAVEEFENAETFSTECHGRFIDAELAHKMLMEGYDLRDVPSADVEPVRRGHWVLTRDEEYEYCRCSECGYDTEENWMIGSKIPYCEQCGSKNYDEETE